MCHQCFICTRLLMDYLDGINIWNPTLAGNQKREKRKQKQIIDL